jgi:hypothetical protein
MGNQLFNTGIAAICPMVTPEAVLEDWIHENKSYSRYQGEICARILGSLHNKLSKNAFEAVRMLHSAIIALLHAIIGNWMFLSHDELHEETRNEQSSNALKELGRNG